MRRAHPSSLLIVPLAIIAGYARGQPPADPLDELRAQLAEQQRVIDAQQQRLATLEGEAAGAASAEDVRAVVDAALADAKQRGEGLGGPVQAGYDRGFFLRDADGNFLLKLTGESQTRYIYNTQDADTAPGDGDENGFQIRRARLAFAGHALSPDLTYRFRLAYDRADGDLAFDDAWLRYAFTDDLALRVGQFKPSFIREENVSGFQQLAIERSYLADYFTIDYTQGVEASYEQAGWRVFAAAHDGSYGLNTDFQSDRTQFAVSGRGEVLVAGSWKQFDDFSSWSGEEPGLLLGVGVAHEWAERGQGTSIPDVLKYSADALFEYAGFNALAAVYFQHFDDNGKAGLPAGLDTADQLGVVLQAGAFVVPDRLELFARYEWADLDGVYFRNSGAGTQGGSGAIADDQVSLVTAGGNYYLRKHNAKLSADIVYALDPLPVGNSGSGLVASGDDGQFALRTQLQVRF